MRSCASCPPRNQSGSFGSIKLSTSSMYCLRVSTVSLWSTFGTGGVYSDAAPRKFLIGGEPLAGEDEPGGAGEDPEVERGGAVVDVPDVELDPLLPGDARAA